jgi:hypothetical protein
MPKPIVRPVVVALALAALVIGVAACGGSSKPDYCSNVSDLQGSVEELGSVKLESGALATVEGDLEEVQSNANAVVSSAKQDFPNETSALKSSVTSLSTAVSQLPPDPTAQELVPLASAIDGTATAAKKLTSATESACE